ncbi:MAG: PKD domain-containing protein [Acidobacteriaceae bacterium]|nr:PKD domain-containing protein [Acidobacteriaceae bacterium]MBV9294277.1 PKD domain-containing protein [Acidobacteriaceae bacterium]MBV9764413.1 PKD domain-containing protein [Acidobacteriaceae bacterium]
MKTRLTPLSSAILSAGLCFATAAFAQDTNTTTNPANAPANNKAGSSQDQYPDLVEIDPFGGISTYGQVQRGLDPKMLDGWVGGLRIAVNPTKYFGLELWGDIARANVHFRTPSNLGVYPATAPANLVGTPIPTYSFKNRNWYLGLNPVLNLKPRGSKFQPYLTVGIDVVQYTPTSGSESHARDPIINSEFYSGNLNDNLQVGFNYGGGVKWHLSDHFGLRLDARGTWSRNPTFDLPNYPDGGIYIPSRDHVLGFQGTVGLVWYFGQSKCPPMPPAPPAPAPLPTPTITGAEGTICQGKPVTLHANLTGAPAGHNLTYAWTVNGQAQGGNTADLTFTPNNTGSFNVQLTVTDTTPPPPPMERPKNIPVRCWVQPPAPAAAAPVTATATLTVNDTTPQITSVTASPNELMCAANANGTHTANLSANVAPSPCGGNLTYKWTVSEGSVSNDTSANATFDASTVNFEGGAQGQTKTITATLTVTDEGGKTATQSTTITVNCQPQFVRLDDVIFAKNNARVNNCGKRVLIDDAAPKVASGDYNIVLVGHRDTDEEANVREMRGRRGRAARRAAAERRALDEQRVLNAAAVLSGGTGTCAKVDPTRIKVDWVGTDQTSETKPGLCGTSNVKERKGSRVTEADKNRRVEVYLVPRNSQAMPPAVKNVKDLPEREVKALGCPK